MSESSIRPRGGHHIKVKKGTHHLFYMAIPCHSIESAVDVSQFGDTSLK